MVAAAPPELAKVQWDGLMDPKSQSKQACFWWVPGAHHHWQAVEQLTETKLKTPCVALKIWPRKIAHSRHYVKSTLMIKVRLLFPPPPPRQLAWYYSSNQQRASTLQETADLNEEFVSQRSLWHKTPRVEGTGGQALLHPDVLDYNSQQA